MRLKQEIVEKIKADPVLIGLLCEKFGGYSTIYRWFTENEEDGMLTRLAAIRIIAKKLNIPEEEVYEEAITQTA